MENLIKFFEKKIISIHEGRIESPRNKNIEEANNVVDTSIKVKTIAKKVFHI